jgi:serine/threonine-protein kinase
MRAAGRLAGILGGNTRESMPMSNTSPTVTNLSAATGEDLRPTLPPEGERGRVDLVADVSRGPEADLTAFVRRRVRQVSVLFLVGYTVFLAREMFAPHRVLVHLDLVGFLLVIPLQAALVALMYSSWPENYRRVRAAEWVGLGTLWAFLGVNQFLCLSNPEATRSLLTSESGEMQVLVGNTWLLPWMVLIIGYSVVVPNPTRRAFALAVLTALVPIAVTAAAVLANGQLAWADTGLLFAQYVIWGSVGVWFAVYGAHQSGRLRQQAYEAKRFGQYRLTRRLGGGGMGDVYLAEHLLLRRPSVIKVVRGDRAKNPAVLQRFEREVRILATLTHWNTVEVFDYGHTADGLFYYVMEYLPGLDLDELVKRHGRLPPGRVVHLLRQVCGALAEAHAAGLIHRDVKPGNVMVCRRGGVADVVKLLDFGLVRGNEPAEPTSAAKLTVEGSVLGTPHFMSPEQAAGKPTDARSDIYSLGATAYFLLCGKTPFDGGAMEVIAAHMLQHPVPLASVCPDLPLELSQVVARCMAKKPEERFATVAELEAALAGCSCATEWGTEQAAAWWGTRIV